MIARDISKKGPNGITFSFCLINNIIDIGSAIKLAKNIDTHPNNGSNIRPNTNINFISPPPNDSFLKILFPIIIIKYMNRNKMIPLII